MIKWTMIDWNDLILVLQFEAKELKKKMIEKGKKAKLQKF